MENYEDFYVYLSGQMDKLKELLDKVTTLHNETAIALLQTSSLNDPQILMNIAKMAVTGQEFDNYLLEGEKFKEDLEMLISSTNESGEDFEKAIEDLKIVKQSLIDHFQLDMDKI